jgi:hypothetical protein
MKATGTNGDVAALEDITRLAYGVEEWSWRDGVEKG